jgi:hypothetical protein
VAVLEASLTETLKISLTLGGGPHQNLSLQSHSLDAALVDAPNIPLRPEENILISFYFKNIFTIPPQNGRMSIFINDFVL